MFLCHSLFSCEHGAKEGLCSQSYSSIGALVSRPPSPHMFTATLGRVVVLSLRSLDGMISCGSRTSVPSDPVGPGPGRKLQGYECGWGKNKEQRDIFFCGKCLSENISQFFFSGFMNCAKGWGTWQRKILLKTHPEPG